MNEINKRLKQFTECVDIDTECIETGGECSNCIVAKMIQKGSDVNLEGKKYTCTVRNFPNLSTDWLLTGEGDMFKSSDTRGVQSLEPNNEAVYNVINNNIFFVYCEVGESECLICNEKEKLVTVLKQQITTLEDQITLLETLLTMKENN